MPKLLQIDTCLNVGSTGRITESIAQLAQRQGWECYIVHGARYVRRPSCMEDIQSVTKWGEYRHYAESLLLDNHGLSSRRATKRIIEEIKKIKPDIIQLHCIHGYYLSYKILFEYLNTIDIPIVWTFHDCWAFTGHCAYFDSIGCEKWKTGCHNCKLKKTYPKSLLLDRSKHNYELKKKLFTSVSDRTVIVPVSYWLEGLVKQSFLRNLRVKTIHNGTNVEVFKPSNDSKLREELGIGDKKMILGVALPWGHRKGMSDMFKLADMLPNNEYQVVLVGLSEKQMKSLPNNVIGITKTNSAKKLADYYSLATAFVNPTYEDNFPTTNIEALACGTPVIMYCTGGSPEAVDEMTGCVVEQGNLNGLVNAIIKMKDQKLSSYNCRKRVIEKYNKDDCFMDYIHLYESLVKR